MSTCWCQRDQHGRWLPPCLRWARLLWTRCGPRQEEKPQKTSVSNNNTVGNHCHFFQQSNNYYVNVSVMFGHQLIKYHKIKPISGCQTPATITKRARTHTHNTQCPFWICVPWSRVLVCKHKAISNRTHTVDIIVSNNCILVQPHSLWPLFTIVFL